MNQIIGPSYELYWKLQIKISWTGTWNIDWKKLKEGRKGEKIKKIKKIEKNQKIKSMSAAFDNGLDATLVD